ncbi:hypothetical protein Taro_011577 [Colocasia esculenta]|uniref:Retrotransposon gag domain-containing protein n=1 Tax=Colocasia esculenta TaxID=4460 RepID=A0A843U699_COLES|nr:hypothetical protein [Colocasia esculenta]
MSAQGQVQEEVSADESELVPGSVPARAGSSRCSVSGTSSSCAGAAGRAKGGAARVSAAVGHWEYRAGRQRTAVTEDRITLLERFLRLQPPIFHSEYDPDKAESWTDELERIFETMECAEEDQVQLAVYQLKGAAHEWWRVQRKTHFQGQRLDHITWQRFSEVFHGEYFPDYALRERWDQFHALVQDDLTVSQYHQRFVQLLRHVPHVAGSDQACAERFIARLRPDLSSDSAGIRSQFRKLSTRGGGGSQQQKR